MIDLLQCYNKETKTLNIPYYFNEKLENILEGTTTIFFYENIKKYKEIGYFGK